MRHISSFNLAIILLIIAGSIAFTITSAPSNYVGAQSSQPTPTPAEETDLRDAGAAPTSNNTNSDSRPTAPERETGSPSLTAVGSDFTYQGSLTDGDSAANGSYDFAFSLYTAQTGGSKIGNTLNKGGVSVVDGVFTVQLDFGANAFAGDSRYLEIGVRPGDSSGAYATLTPRQPVTPAPYAMHANNADNLGGAPPSSYLRKRTGTQVSTTLAPGETQRWFTHSWATDEVVTWQVYPTSPGGRITSSVEVELESSAGVGNGKIKYYIVITNVGPVTTDAEARYVVFR
jgi:hypothetical protein